MKFNTLPNLDVLNYILQTKGLPPTCVICGKHVSIFNIAPILHTHEGCGESCEECADKHFPNWRDEKK